MKHRIEPVADARLNLERDYSIFCRSLRHKLLNDGPDAGTDYCRNPIQFSDTTSEFPGFCESYFTEVCNPNRQECRLIQCRR